MNRRPPRPSCDIRPTDLHTTPMIAHAYVHIGTYKTGSTSLQASLVNSSQELAKQGLYYPSTIGTNHSVSLKNAFFPEGLSRQARVIHGIRQKKDSRALRNKVLECFDNTDTDTFQSCILSGESLSTFDRESCLKLSSWIKSHCNQVTVIVYVRNPISWCASKAQQRIKTGADIESVLSSDPMLPCYRESIQPWMDTFGDDNVRIFSFEAACNHDNGLYGHFLQACRAEWSDEIARLEVRRNKRLSIAATYMINAWNTKWPRVVGNKLGARRWAADFAKFYEIEGDKFALPAANEEVIWKTCQSDLDWLRDVSGIEYDYIPSTRPRVTLDESTDPSWLKKAEDFMGPHVEKHISSMRHKLSKMRDREEMRLLQKEIDRICGL